MEVLESTCLVRFESHSLRQYLVEKAMRYKPSRAQESPKESNYIVCAGMTIRTNPAVSFPKVFRYALRIHVQRSVDIGVSQQFLLHLHVNLRCRSMVEYV